MRGGRNSVIFYRSLQIASLELDLMIIYEVVGAGKYDTFVSIESAIVSKIESFE